MPDLSLLRDLYAQAESFSSWVWMAIPLAILCVVIASWIDDWQRKRP